MTEQLTPIEALAKEVLLLWGNPYVRSMVDNRIAEFIQFKEKDSYAWFEELVYCLLAAFSSAKMSQLCVEALCVDNLIIYGGQEMIAETLRNQGHRFAEKRAEYIFDARHLAPNLKRIIQGFKTSKTARNWLVANVKGLGWKEASHILRNLGYLDVAIIDRHILSNMKEYGLISDNDRRSLTRNRYLEYEHLLKKVAKKVNMTLGELDLYLWYRKTGKVLK